MKENCTLYPRYGTWRGTSTHHNLRKEVSATRQINGEPATICTSEDETQTDLGCELPYYGRVRGQ